jgi:serine/threonine protein kinase
MDLEEDIPTQKTEAKSGQKIGGCILERKLGEGGMGSVWEAHQISLERKVAVKILSPELSSDREFVERFKREARLVGRLQSPYIVQVYDTGAEEGIGYIVMERLQGMSLQDRIDDSGPLNESESLRILSEVSRGLAVAHAQGLVHRDIKPANIFLCSDGTTKILDFGIAHDRLSDITRTGEILGTPNYMSPEHGCGKEVTEKSDLYALGSTIYAALTGTPPFRGGTPVAVLRMHIDEPPVPLRGIQPGLNELILSLMEKRASERPTNADKVAEIAEKLRDGKTPIRWPRIPRQLVWGILGATLLAAAGFGLKTLLKEREPIVVEIQRQRNSRFATFQVTIKPNGPKKGTIQIVLDPKEEVTLAASERDAGPVANYAIDISPPPGVTVEKTELLYPEIEDRQEFTIPFQVEKRGEVVFHISISYLALGAVPGTVTLVPLKKGTADFRITMTVH